MGSYLIILYIISYINMLGNFIKIKLRIQGVEMIILYVYKIEGL